MRAKGRLLLTGVCLCVYSSTVQAQLPAEALEAYQQHRWQSAIKYLEPQKTENGAMRMLALSYFRTLDFNKALPALRQAVLTAPDDIELIVALLEVLVADELNAEAVKVVDQLSEDNRAQAIKHLNVLVEEAEPETASRAADVLIELLYEDREFGQAYEVAQTAIKRDPDSALAFRFSKIRPRKQAEPHFSAFLGYRFEFDDNVSFPDDIFASSKEDLRHVLIADLLYERPFGEGWSFYAQGNFLQSFHHDLDRFDLTRIAGTAAIGKASQRMGWRFPVEVSHDRLDGDAFRTSLAAIPGFYLQFGDNFFSHFYARLQYDDYDVFLRQDEDRSGDITGTGVLLVGQFSQRFKLRSYLEFNHYDTDGSYWERDEIVAFVFGEFEFTPKWVAGLALRYQDEDYDNARPDFADRQQDESKEFYLNLTHKFAEQWHWRGQLSLINHESNITIFDYDRNVYSFSVIREF